VGIQHLTHKFSATETEFLSSIHAIITYKAVSYLPFAGEKTRGTYCT